MQSVTTERFCSNHGTRKTQPTVTSNNRCAQGSSLTMSLVFFWPPSATASLLRTGRTPPARFSTAYPSTELRFSATLVTFLANQEHIQKFLYSGSYSVFCFHYYPPNLNIPMMFQIICSDFLIYTHLH